MLRGGMTKMAQSVGGATRSPGGATSIIRHASAMLMGGEESQLPDYTKAWDGVSAIVDFI